MTIAVEFQSVTRHFGPASAPIRAVDGVDLAITEGSFFAMLGPSGSGKTTCLRLISGFESPTTGEIRIFGASVGNIPPHLRNVNTVFQDYALFPHMNVRDNVAYGLMVKGIARRTRYAKAEEMLSLVHLDAYGDRKPGQLSGGQRQRVALARALVNEPRVLLLDEPLGALDLKLREAMQDELKSLQQRLGITFIFVTHDQEEALTMSDRIGVMSAGKLQQVGSPREIYTHPVNRFVASFIGETNFLPATRDGNALRLAGGHMIEMPAEAGSVAATGKPVTVTIRPEQVRLLETAESGAIPATITSLVYFGTDTHCHMAMADGTELVARVQSPATGTAGLVAGQRVAVRFAPGAAQVLED